MWKVWLHSWTAAFQGHLARGWLGGWILPLLVCWPSLLTSLGVYSLESQRTMSSIAAATSHQPSSSSSSQDKVSEVQRWPCVYFTHTPSSWTVVAQDLVREGWLGLGSSYSSGRQGDEMDLLECRP